MSRGRLRVAIVVVIVAMIAVGSVPAVSAQQDVVFEYDSEPPESATVDTEKEYTHTFSVETNATDGPLIMAVYYNESAGFSYNSHTVRVNDSETIPTQQSIDTTTVENQKLTRIHLINRSVAGTNNRSYDVDVKLSAPSDTGEEIVYSGGTHAPTGETLPLNETDVTIESSGGNNNNNNNGGGGGGGGGGGLGGAPPSTDEGPPSVADVRSTLNFASTQAVAEVQTGGSSTVTPEDSATVSEVAFDADSVDTTLTVEDYGEPPATVAEEIRTSAQSDDVDISSEDNIISLVTVTTDLSPQADESATVTLTIDRDNVNDPSSLEVVKDKYSFDQQQDIWETKPTTVTNTNDETITVETEVDDFSMLAVVEQESTGEQEPPTNESEQTNEETDDLIPLPILLPIVTIILTAGLLSVLSTQRNKQD